MARIRIEVSGDHWVNRAQVVDQISAAVGEPYLVFELNTEGPSLHALGIIQTIEQGIQRIGIPADSVWIDCWHNAVEQIPYRRAFRPDISHFFWLCERYRHTDHEPVHDTRPLAFFVGRLVLERAVMLWEILKSWPQSVMVSLMRQHAYPQLDLLDLDQWIMSHERSQFLDWCRDPPVTSITHHWVRDQYRESENTNRDLVRHYAGFHVELVAETYCQGDTFFPTEKTVRPLSQGKPMLIYGPQRFLSRLHDLGFQTWHDIWDETYDELAGAARWHAMKRNLQIMLDQKLYLDPRISAIAEHNRSNLDRLITQHRPG